MADLILKPFVHEKGMCDSESVGAGTRIWAFAHVLKGAIIGQNCNIGECAFIESGAVLGNGCTIKNGVSVWDKVTLEDDVFVGPNAVFTNDFTPRAFIKTGSSGFLPTIVKKGSTIGANATIVCGITLGEYCFIGAGAVVIRDVPPHSLILGNPGKIRGQVCYCGQKLNAEQFCKSCNLVLSKNSAARVGQR